ncbi:hypothetical protein ACFE04_019671 [Oxalis oulophora]
MNRRVQPQSLLIRLGGVQPLELREMSLTVPQAKIERGEKCNYLIGITVPTIPLKLILKLNLFSCKELEDNYQLVLAQLCPGVGLWLAYFTSFFLIANCNSGSGNLLNLIHYVNPSSTRGSAETDTMLYRKRNSDKELRTEKRKLGRAEGTVFGPGKIKPGLPPSGLFSPYGIPSFLIMNQDERSDVLVQGTGPARFGSASWSAQKQVLKDNQPLRITIVVPNRDGDSGPSICSVPSMNRVHELEKRSQAFGQPREVQPFLIIQNSLHSSFELISQLPVTQPILLILTYGKGFLSINKYPSVGRMHWKRFFDWSMQEAPQAEPLRQLHRRWSFGTGSADTWSRTSLSNPDYDSSITLRRKKSILVMIDPRPTGDVKKYSLSPSMKPYDTSRNRLLPALKSLKYFSYTCRAAHQEMSPKSCFNQMTSSFSWTVSRILRMSDGLHLCWNLNLTSRLPPLIRLSCKCRRLVSTFVLSRQSAKVDAKLKAPQWVPSASNTSPAASLIAMVEVVTLKRSDHCVAIFSLMSKDLHWSGIRLPALAAPPIPRRARSSSGSQQSSEPPTCKPRLAGNTLRSQRNHRWAILNIEFDCFILLGASLGSYHPSSEWNFYEYEIESEERTKQVPLHPSVKWLQKSQKSKPRRTEDSSIMEVVPKQLHLPGSTNGLSCNGRKKSFSATDTRSSIALQETGPTFIGLPKGELQVKTFLSTPIGLASQRSNAFSQE